MNELICSEMVGTASVPSLESLDAENFERKAYEDEREGL